MTTHLVSPRRDTDATLDEHLQQFEIARQRQLDAIPSTGLDPVAAAYRAAVVRILEEVRTARRRLAEGRYGICNSCTDPIAVVRLQQRPWAITCVRCNERPRW
jgi:RNA polymerase-binding transcription factor DksA